MVLHSSDGRRALPKRFWADWPSAAPCTPGRPAPPAPAHSCAPARRPSLGAAGAGSWNLRPSVALRAQAGPEQLHFHFSLSCIGEGNGNLLQCSCLENPWDGGAWWASIYGCLAAQTKRWAEGIRVPGPLAGGGSTTARGKLRLCPSEILVVPREKTPMGAAARGNP